MAYCGLNDQVQIFGSSRGLSFKHFHTFSVTYSTSYMGTLSGVKLAEA